MGLVMDLADRVMVVDFGVPIATGTPDEVQRHPDVDPRLPRRGGRRRRHDQPRHPDPRRTPRQMPDAVALREKDLGIWRELTWADVLGARPARRARAARPGRRRPATGSRSTPRTGPSGSSPTWARSPSRATSVGLYPTNPAAEVGYLLGDSGARVLVAEDQEQVDKALAVLDECPDLERIVYLEPRGIRHRYDHEKLLAWAGLPRAGPRAPRAAPRRARRACSPASGPTTSPP